MASRAAQQQPSHSPTHPLQFVTSLPSLQQSTAFIPPLQPSSPASQVCSRGLRRRLRHVLAASLQNRASSLVAPSVSTITNHASSSPSVSSIASRDSSSPSVFSIEEATVTPSTVENANSLKRKSDDIGWEYGKLVDPNNKDRVICNFCKNVNTEGINRFKKHIAQVGGGVAKCKSFPDEPKLACLKWLEGTEKKKQDKVVRELGLRSDVNVSSGVQQEEGLTCVVVAFNSIENDEFKQMVEAIGQFGPGLKPPTQYELREPLLKAEYARTKSLLSDREVEKEKNGCSIMTDAWTDMKRRSIMNIVTHCAEGTSFIKSKDTSGISHTGEVIFELVDNAIEEVGAEHVVQVVTDNASNNMAAKALLLEKRPNIFWSSCATHTINLMLQGIDNIPRFKKIVDQDKGFTIFIYGPHRTLECMRSFTKKREIIRPGVTRFASQFLTLQSLFDKKQSLRKMVVDAKWENIKETSSKKGKEAYYTVLSVRFWNGVEVCLKVFEPLVKLLRLVDGDVKPSMGFVYGELLKATIEIKEAFKNEELRYKEVIAIVEKKMRGKLDAPLHLTAYLLNPHYSYADSSIFDNADITTALITCVEQFYHGCDEDIYDEVVNIEFTKFQRK
ncbi:unnamed protein product [Linum tenue]|uniref:DUF659 domain-containing protein n=1 Tax=Linum tenue TaxID=586396 RepID=A0AAV0NJS4_9ROSI|nr:unnamed protein product [Linum tenue]